MSRRLLLIVPLGLLLCSGTAPAQVTIGPEARVPADPRQQYSRYVRFRPADQQVVTLNPPRFSWPYLPDIVPGSKTVRATQKFTLQISASSQCADPAVEIKDTPCNFFNFLPVLRGQKTWYWRVGYNVGSDKERWSDVRRFTLADEAVEWDRSEFQQILDGMVGHPRILFNADDRDQIRKLRESDPYCGELANNIVTLADRTLKQSWFRSFPKRDDRKLRRRYMDLSYGLLTVAFARTLTGDPKYTGYKERFVTMASWPKGGFSSPEGILQQTDKWETHITEHLGLFYDWCYDELSPDERAIVLESLRWRIDQTLNNFAWRRNSGRVIPGGSIALSCSSHAYQNIMATMIGAMAVHDELPVAREALQIGTHYLVGITSGHGEDEAWKEGPGYGNGKMKWLTNATCCLQSAAPRLQLGKNEMYSNYCDFFARITPIGAQHCSFGNRGINERDWASSRIHNFRRVAALCGDPVAMQNWIDTRRRLADLGRHTALPGSPWFDYVLPLYTSEPQPHAETKLARLYPLEGWVTASSAPPSDYGAQKGAVSITFRCSPRGGYGHSFRNENAFDIHAYGTTIACGGGNTSNGNPFANNTASHNTILVNGQEQVAAKRGSGSCYGRIVAFRQGDGFVYWAGDATAAYGADTGLRRFVRHVLMLENAYFVIFDDLALADDVPAGQFQWLYHYVPYTPADFDGAQFRFQYSIDQTQVLVQHLAHIDDLQFVSLRGETGMVNQFTGEELKPASREIRYRDGTLKKTTPPYADAQHIWVQNKTPTSRMQFLAAIVPFRADEPAPHVERLSDRMVRVTFRGKGTTVLFDDGDPAAAGVGQVAPDITVLTQARSLDDT